MAWSMACAAHVHVSIVKWCAASHLFRSLLFRSAKPNPRLYFPEMSARCVASVGTSDLQKYRSFGPEWHVSSHDGLDLRGSKGCPAEGEGPFSGKNSAKQTASHRPIEDSEKHCLSKAVLTALWSRDALAGLIFADNDLVRCNWETTSRGRPLHKLLKQPRQRTKIVFPAGLSLFRSQR